MAGRLQETTDRLRQQRQQYNQRIDDFFQQLTDRQQRLYVALRFLTVFTAMAAPFYLVLNSGWDATTLRIWTADAAGSLLNVAELPVTQTGSTLQTGELVVDVSRDSTGWKSVMAFTALVAATQRQFRAKLAGIMAGTAVLMAANVVRVASMIYAVKVYNVDYELLHTVLWRWGLAAAVLGTWAAWLYYTQE